MRRERPHPAARVAVLAALGLALAQGCGRKTAGEACSQGHVACQDEHTGLFCVSGHFATMTCLGPAGCEMVSKGDVACDNPVASVGDGCNQAKDTACTADRTKALICTGEKFVLAQPCKGPRGCTTSGETVYCDNTLAEAGDLCSEEGDTACKTDRSSFMKCVGGKFRIANSCRGPKRCTVTEKPDENKEHFECDDSVTEIGDPCEDEGEESCSTDHKSQNACKAHAIALSKPCPGPSGCKWDPSRSHFECDTRKK
jgi:hypothetical protein